MKALKLQIHGKVQGVGYRRWFEQQAIALDLKGYVKNLKNGDVEAVICGNEEAVHEMLKRSLVGPFNAQVLETRKKELMLDECNYVGFKILRN